MRPAQLVHRARGTTPSNPIVVEEEESRRKNCPSKDVKKLIGGLVEQPNLPVPTKQEILAWLVKEKDVLPIIRSLINLTSPNAPRPPPRRSPSASSGPRTEVIGQHATGYPMKKRKLRSVPAGAADWDCPYPFKEDEGPEAYGETWAAERSKELISQLIKLIKSATQKAAMAKYMKQVSKGSKGKGVEDPHGKYDEGPNINKYYRPSTATYGVRPAPARHDQSRQSTPAFGHGNSNNASRSTSPSTSSVGPSSSTATTPSPESAQESSSLDHLLSQLFAMSSQSVPSSQPSQASVPPTPSTTTMTVTSTTSTGTVTPVVVQESSGFGAGGDQAWLDEWMKMIDPSVKMNSDGSFPPPPANSAATGFEGDSFPMDFGFPSFDLSQHAPSSGNPTASSGDCQVQDANHPAPAAGSDPFATGSNSLGLEGLGQVPASQMGSTDALKVQLDAPANQMPASSDWTTEGGNSTASGSGVGTGQWDLDMLSLLTGDFSFGMGMEGVVAGDHGKEPLQNQNHGGIQVSGTWVSNWEGNVWF